VARDVVPADVIMRAGIAGTEQPDGAKMLPVVRVFVLGSGSSGNCLVLEAEGERLVLDAGIGPNRATERMRALGADLITSRPPLGLFVTHDHGDHASHAMPLARALRAPLYVHPGLPFVARKRVEVVRYVPGKPIVLGPFSVDALPIPHDAPHVAFRVSAGGKRFAIATDLGHVTRELRGLLGTCDLVMLEANHCPELLETGPYPPRLKRRVGGPLGHLANHQTADLAAALEDTRVSRLVLSHISRTNNTLDRALTTVGARLRRGRVTLEALAQGEARRLEVTETRRLAHAEQLGFGF
jgi:phosphoribosyl 1,2-cyclic phosphodiesterase